MGVGLYAITGHNFNYHEIIEFQEKIENDNELRNLLWWEPNGKPGNWKEKLNPKRLEEFWLHNENRKEIDGVFFYDYLSLPTFYGEITFHRNIAELEGFGLNFWTMLYDDELRENILKFNSRLGVLLDQQKVIYYGDRETSWIGDSIYGKTIKDIADSILDKGLGLKHNISKSIEDENLYIQEIE